MAGLASYTSVIILTANLLIQSFCLDIHQPEYAQAAPAYVYPQNVQAVQQIHYPYPNYNGMHYQSQSLDESYRQADYHRALTQQNYGNMIRRSPQPTYRQTPCALRRQQLQEQQDSPYRCYRSVPGPVNFRAYPYCDTHKYPTTNINQGAESVPIRGRDFRSVVESPETQSGDAVATRTWMTMPMYLSDTSLNFNDVKDKRAAQAPPTTFYDRRNKKKNATVTENKIVIEKAEPKAPIQPATTTSETSIVDPSRFYLNPNVKPKLDMIKKHDTPSDDSSADDANCEGGAFGNAHDTKMTENLHPTEINLDTIDFLSNNPGYPGYLGTQIPPINLSGKSAIPPVDTRHLSASNIQQLKPNYESAIHRQFQNPYDYFKGRTANSSVSPSSRNGSRRYPIYYPDMNRNESVKYPQLPISH